MPAWNGYTPAGYFVVSMILLGLAASPFFRAADVSWHAQTQRAATIDGLRGFLALAVFFHHAAVYHRYLIDGVWAIPPSPFYTELGQAAVILFFMITGFLFWGKAIDAQGKLDWRTLYVGRIFRIGPMYYLVTIAMLAIVLGTTGFHGNEPASALVLEGLRLLLLGYYGPNTINGYRDAWAILAGVTWTLHFEWLFYLLVLPISAVFFARSKTHLPFAATGYTVAVLVLFQHAGVNAACCAAFFAGMLCASLRSTGFAVDDGTNPRRFANRIASVLALSMLAIVVRMPSAYAPVPILLLGAVFFLCSSGTSLFGLLHWRASKRLGEISYGIYLLQGLVLYAFFQTPRLHAFALSSTDRYWAIVLLAATALIFCALLAHIAIEKPGIRLGRRLALRIRPPSATKADHRFRSDRLTHKRGA